VREDVVEELPEAERQPLHQVVGELHRVVGDVLDDLLDLGDHRPERSGRNPEDLEQSFDDELDRIVEEAVDCVRDAADEAAAFLRSSEISARTSSTACDDRSTRSLLKLSRVA
jgi:hypothetical protein